MNGLKYWLGGSRIVFWMRDEKAGMSLVLFLEKIIQQLLLLQKKLPLTSLAQCLMEGSAILGDDSLLG